MIERKRSVHVDQCRSGRIQYVVLDKRRKIPDEGYIPGFYPTSVLRGIPVSSVVINLHAVQMAAIEGRDEDVAFLRTHARLAPVIGADVETDNAVRSRHIMGAHNGDTIPVRIVGVIVLH